MSHDEAIAVLRASLLGLPFGERRLIAFDAFDILAHGGYMGVELAKQMRRQLLSVLPELKDAVECLVATQLLLHPERRKGPHDRARA